jgi:hypothetical protein
MFILSTLTGESEKGIGEYFKVKPEDLQRKKRIPEASIAKNVLAYLGYQELGSPSKDLVDFFHMSRQCALVSIRKGKSWMDKNSVNLLL